MSNKKPAKKEAKPQKSKAPSKAELKLAEEQKLQALQAQAQSGEEVDEDEMEAAAAGSMSSGPDAAGLALATAATAEPSNLKNFRHQPEMENFYRFVNDNDLRYEAHLLLDVYLNAKRKKRMVKNTKSKAH